MPVEVGVGYVSVVPSTRGFGPELQRQITGPSGDAGQRAGRESGSGFLSGIGGVLKAGVAGVAAGAGVLFAAGFAKAVEQDKATAKLGAQLGLSSKESARLGKIAGSVYAKGYGESIDQISDSLKALAQNGVAAVNAPQKDLAALSKSAVNLAETFDADVSDSARAAGQLIKTGLAKDGKQAFDLITKGFQSGADKAGDFLDTINEYSTQWRKAGIDGATGIGLINQALRAGARDGDVAADAIKEFSIRAVDGSDTTASGFKALGLNADNMASKFAKGGKVANGVLDLTLDKLRGIKDPVRQSQIAVELFGTQAEDLGASLLAMDPSTAAAGLGQVGGAADKMGKTLHDTATNGIEVFKRQALQGLATVADKYALPAVTRLGQFLNDRVLPPAKAVGSVMLSTLVPAVTGTASAFAAGAQWVQDYGAWLLPLGVAVGGLALTMGASAIATGAATATFSIYRGVILATAAVTRGYAVAQGVLNAVMNANPIGLIITGVAALAALLVVAYKKSDTFRSIVQGAWAGIQAAASVAWNSAIKPVVDGFMTGLRAIGTAASWLWSTVLSPVFGFIGTAAKVLLVVAIFPIVAAFKLLAAVGSWLWSTVLGPVFGWIADKAIWLWTVAIKPAFNSIVAQIKAVGAVASWLWKNVFSPVLGWIGDKAVSLWNNRIKPAWDLMRIGIGLLGDKLKDLWETKAKPVFQWIGDKASWLWNKATKPAFDALKLGVKAVSDSFGKAKDAIKLAWDKVEGIAKKPVAFVIDTVYNKGIRGVWNQIAGAFGAPKLPAFKGFAGGGILPGQSSWRNGDDQLVPMRRGEGVYVSEAMRDPYERARLHAVNQAAMHGRSLSAYQGGGFAKGGIFGWVKSAASKGVDLASSGISWLKDGVKASAEAGLNSVVKPLINKISGSTSLYRDMITGIPKKMIKDILGYSGKADSEMEKAGVGGKGYKAALSWARTQNGKPYQWGGNGNPSWDCSGLVSAIESVIRGERPHRRWATGSFSGATAPAGWVRNARSPYMIGITNAGVGHTAGTLNGVNVESRGGDGVVIGSRARSYHDPLFTDVYGFKGYADGGSPRPGEIAWVGENGPELIRFSGGEVVYSNRDSMAMSAGLGPVRGFAKGTSKARKPSKIGTDLTGFQKSLTGSASAIASAAKRLTKDLGAAGKAGRSLVKSTEKASAKLQAMAKQRDAVASKITAARGYASDKSKSAADYLNVSNFADVGSVGDLIAGMKDRQATVKGFQSAIATAQKRGASKTLISQLIEMGPDSQLAGLVSRATGGDMKQLNALVSSGSKLSTSYGRSMADLMYDAGKDASKGFLAGLLGEQKGIQDAMAKLGAGAIKAIRSKKGIDAHSPSRKGAQAGADVGAGVVAGMAAMAPAVAAQAARLGKHAVPAAAVVPVTSQRAGSDPLASLDGMAVALVLDDGQALAAHFDTRVDARLSTVRRSARAGARR
ncbi:phage tail tape measure protein [Streptomyces sp. ADI95-17]|uniref:phage tail tape measure protein n=1 Tax=Streptomyces sp. ADI95-17 TaxID=1522759 RepID=UPI000F5BFC17|nr:phage tail tape measure protein [Streptomyces sp. ADI95-17]RPK74453.1 Phage-related minor tail protein [Streptomyces sp. ADI95-17]